MSVVLREFFARFDCALARLMNSEYVKKQRAQFTKHWLLTIYFIILKCKKSIHLPDNGKVINFVYFCTSFHVIK